MPNIASARCPCRHYAMQKRYVNGPRTYTFLNDNTYFRAREPKRPNESIRCTETTWTVDTSLTRGELKV